MKTISKLSLVLVFVLASLNTYAIDGDFLLNVKKGKGNEISFALNGKQKVKVTIYDINQNVLFAEYATGTKGILKTYNLDEFPEGKYYLIVSTDYKSVKHEIIVNATHTVLSKRPVLEVYIKEANNKKLVEIK
ncbi:secretion protein [Flavobacterium sp. RSSA_27]|uniref:secretion protein n=1 Tax=Flavobacterium sp. RSSA_27 TaxID=3447667 RepID=UPI003F2B9A47